MRSCSSTLGDVSESYVDSSLRRYVYRYRVDNTTVGDSRNVFCRRRILYRADEDLYRILVSLDTDQFESVLHDANRAGLATSGNSRPHHVVDQPFDNVDCRFSKSLVFVSTTGVRKENGTGRDVTLQPRIFRFDACGGPHAEDLDFRSFLEFLAHGYRSFPHLAWRAHGHFNRSCRKLLP